MRARIYPERGTTLVELLVSTAAAAVILAALIAASFSIQRSIASTNQLVANTTGQSRILDYVAQDLRRALRVGILTGGTNVPLRAQQGVAITDAHVLTVDIPDYYASNTPDNAAGSPYKTARYARSLLDVASSFNGHADARLNGIVPWAEASMTLRSALVPRYAPPAAGDGTVQVRYYKAPRAPGDSAIAFFRAEFPSGASSPVDVREVADCVSAQTADATLTVSGLDEGRGLRIEASVTPHLRFPGVPAGAAISRQDVILRNLRRD